LLCTGAPAGYVRGLLTSMERRGKIMMMRILAVAVLAAGLVGLTACAKESKPAPAPASTGLSK
jgi:hypothetical protein